jgi:hypothetical protein
MSSFIHEDSDSPAPQAKPALLRSALAFLVTFALFTLLWAIYINPYYFPYGDSFALFVNSTPLFHPSISAWFLQGFRPYFDVYPDMSLHATNFIRPVVNGTFFLGWFAWGTHWSRYLLTTYAIIGLIAATTCFLSSYVLKLGWRLTLLATVCVAIAPSIDTGAIFDPTFAFDLLAGLLVLLGATALIFDALIPCWIFLALAVFTKEPALFAPALAAVIIFFRRDEKPLLQRIAISAAFLVPLATWLILRWSDFHSEKGVYVFIDSSSHGPIHVMLVRIILGLTTWPIAAVVYWSSIPLLLRLLQKASLVINIVFWPVLAVLLMKKIVKSDLHPANLFTPLRARGKDYAVAVLALFCATSLLIPLVLNVPRRFGGVFYPLFILCFAASARYAKSPILRVTSAVLVAIVGVTGATLILADLHYQTAGVRASWALSRDYVSQLSASTEPELFVVDDLSGRYSSTEYVKLFSGYKGQLIRVNDLGWNFTCGAVPRVIVESHPDGDASITSIVPKACGDHSFNSVFPPVDPKTISFTRNLPAVTLHYDLSQQPNAFNSTPGTNTLHIELHRPMPGSSVLFADPLALRYRKTSLDAGLGAPQ